MVKHLPCCPHNTQALNTTTNTQEQLFTSTKVILLKLHHSAAPAQADPGHASAAMQPQPNPNRLPNKPWPALDLTKFYLIFADSEET